jgi:hypothetical protein
LSAPATRRIGRYSAGALSVRSKLFIVAMQGILRAGTVIRQIVCFDRINQFRL